MPRLGGSFLYYRETHALRVSFHLDSNVLYLDGSASGGVQLVPCQDAKDGQNRPQVKGKPSCVERLISSSRGQGGPLLEVSVQHRGALTILPVPCNVVVGDGQRLLDVGLHCGVDCDADHMAEQIVADCADDVGRAH